MNRIARQILHLDLDAFYASVETLMDPTLEGKPLIVAMGDVTGRGVVATASYPARRYGVHSAMPLREAMRLCPQAVIVPVRHALYAEFSERVMALLHGVSPLVEQVSIDEAYVEIPSDLGNAAERAHEIQQRIRTELGLDCTVAVASNKLVSKIACNTVKPRGFIVVPLGEEEAFLAPLSIDKLPGAGRVTRSKLTRWNVRTIGDLQHVPAAELRSVFGSLGIYLHEAALGQDDSPVVTETRQKSVSAENTFDRDTEDPNKVDALVRELCEEVSGALEKGEFRARTIVLKLRYGDFTTITRQVTLKLPVADAASILACARRLLDDNWNGHRPIRLIGVGAHNLVESSAGTQMQFSMEPTT